MARPERAPLCSDSTPTDAELLDAHVAGDPGAFSALIRLVIRALSTCMASAARRQSHVPVFLRSNVFMNFEAPSAGVALIHYCEIEVRVMDEEVV